MRTSKTRQQMRDILGGKPGSLVILDIRDDVSFLNQGKSDGTLRQWVNTCLTIGIDANVIVGEADYLPANHPLGRKRRLISETLDRRIVEVVQPTQRGPLQMLEVTEAGQKPARAKLFLENESDYELATAFLRELRNCRRDVVAHLAAMRAEIGDLGLLCIFVHEPFEMYSFISPETQIYHYIDWPATYRQAMEEVEATALFLIECAKEAGADLIMFSGCGTELFNPEIIEHHIVRSAIGYAQLCRTQGLFSLMHCCGRTQLYLDRGWLAQIRPTIFESFTSAPLGDIDDPPSAARQLPSETFFKGGLSLDLLRRRTPEHVARATREAYSQFGDRRFILAGTCMVLTGTPRENLAAVTNTAMELAH